MKFLMVLTATIVLDIIWARYIQRVNDGHRFLASFWALCLAILGAYVITSYVHDIRLIVATGLGAFIGTYIGSRRKSEGP